MHLIDARTLEASGGLTVAYAPAEHGARAEYMLLREGVAKRQHFPMDPSNPGPVASRHFQLVANLGVVWSEAEANLVRLMNQPDARDAKNGLHVPGYAPGESLSPAKKPNMETLLTEFIPFGPFSGGSVHLLAKSEPKYLFAIAEGHYTDLERQQGRWLGFLRLLLAPQLAARAAERAKDPAKVLLYEARHFNRKRLAPLAGRLHAGSREPGDFRDRMAQRLDAGEALENFPPSAVESMRDIYIKATYRVTDPKDPRYQAEAARFNRDFFLPDIAVARTATPTSLAADMEKARRGVDPRHGPTLSEF